MEGFLGIIYLASCLFILTEKPLHPLLKYIVFYLFIFARYATSCLYFSLSCITWGTWRLLRCLTGMRPRGSIRSHDKARPPPFGRERAKRWDLKLKRSSENYELSASASLTCDCGACDPQRQCRRWWLWLPPEDLPGWRRWRRRPSWEPRGCQKESPWWQHWCSG